MPENVNIRWMIRRDLDEVVMIESNSFAFPWTDDDFRIALRQRNVIGCIAEIRHDVVGYMIYELHKDAIRIVNFAVDSEHRRQGIGGQMVIRLKEKLSEQRRHKISLEVRETNVTAQKFFASCGFMAVECLRNHYGEYGESAIRFLFSLDGSSTEKRLGTVVCSTVIRSRERYEVVVRLEDGSEAIVESPVNRKPGERVTVYV